MSHRILTLFRLLPHYDHYFACAMNLKCCICLKYFQTVDELIEHLKKIHRFKNNHQNIKCPVDFENEICCNKTVKTFDALKKHVNICSNSKSILCINEELCDPKSQSNDGNRENNFEECRAEPELKVIVWIVFY